MPQYQYPKLKVNSPNVKYSADSTKIESVYEYDHVQVVENKSDNSIEATPMTTKLSFQTQTLVPKTGMMLVGLGGNNGSTVTAAILANKKKMSFETKDGVVEANYFGSVTQSSTVFVGTNSQTNKDYYVPMNEIVPLVHPNDLAIDGWDISSMNLGDAMKRAKVLDVSLQAQLYPFMKQIVPRKALFDKNFVAANQEARADNILDSSVMSKWQMVEQLMADIKDFKTSKKLDKVIVLWTANTERYTELISGVHDTADNLLAAVKAGNIDEISPSTMYGIAAILSGCTFINGSPQNTFVPGLIELAEREQVYIGGDDFKSGQTKFKSVLVDFLVNAGIKPCSIVSYNHLGNNDGFNLSAPQTFRSKEISKASVVDDMVESNKILYGDPSKQQHPDHCIVIKYVPYVGDSKRALDEYTSELMFGGKSTIVSHNTCEDSLLAAPLIIDLVLIAELCERIKFKVLTGNAANDWQQFNSVLSILSYLCKAPLVEKGAKVVNALFKQRACVENLLRALIALPALNHMDFEHKLSRPSEWNASVKKINVVDVDEKSVVDNGKNVQINEHNNNKLVEDQKQPIATGY